MIKIVNGELVSTTWEEERYITYYFPVICAYPGVDMGRVYPIMQRDVAKICDVVSKDDRVEAVVLFGSAANIRCTRESDLDIAVRLKSDYVNYDVKNEVSEQIQEACNWNADIIWRDRMTEQDAIYDEILRGVRLK